MPKIGTYSKDSPDLVKSLTKYLDAEEERELNRPYTANFIDIDDYDNYYDGAYEDDFSALVYPYSQRSSLMGPSDEDDTFDADYYDKHKNDKKSIYFYPNVYLKTSRIEFETLKQFNDFCDKNEILMSNDTVNQLIYNKVSHCALDPVDELTGDKVVVADRSYGGLYYSIADELDC